jgi:hypothetical protein
LQFNSSLRGNIMATPDPKTDYPETDNGFFINAGTHSGWFKTPAGDVYDIRKLEPRDVTDPRSGEVATLWGGYATARDRDLAAKDAILQAEFKKSGNRPAEFFSAESKDIPLYITLRHRPGKGYSDIGSFWNARGRFTVLARDLEGKRGLRFAGNVLDWKSTASLEAERAAKPPVETPAPTPAPDANAARQNASARAKKGRDKAPSADA